VEKHEALDSFKVRDVSDMKLEGLVRGPREGLERLWARLPVPRAPLPCPSLRGDAPMRMLMEHGESRCAGSG